MPSTPFAHMLGAGRTEHPPSLSICKKAPLPGLLPPSLRATCCVCALPHPLLKCGGRDRRDSAHPPFHLPLCPGYATPLPWVMTCLTSPHPPPSPFACMPGRHKGQCPPFLFVAVPSTWATPLPFPFHLGAPPHMHALLCACWKRRRDEGAHKGSATQRVPYVRRACGRGGPCTMGLHVRGHVSVEVQRVCKQGKVQPRQRVLCASGAGVKMRQRGLVCSQVQAKGEGVQVGAGYNQAGGQCMNKRWHTLFPHPCTQ